MSAMCHSSPILRKCELDDAALNILFGLTFNDTEAFGTENTVGWAGTEDEIAEAVNSLSGNKYTVGQVLACIPPAPPQDWGSEPSVAGISQGISYHPPGLPHVPVPIPINPTFNYGDGYTTYMNPFQMSSKVPEYKPNALREATSYTELLLALANMVLDWFRPSPPPADHET